MILIGGASETYRGGMGAFQEERQVLIASPFCKFAHGIESVQRIPYYVEMATRHAIYGRPGATYLDMPDDIIRGKCDLDQAVKVERVGEPPRMVAPTENVEAALNLLERAERPLVILGKGMAWSRGEDEVRAFLERTQLPFVRSPMGKGVMPDDHPLSAGAARTLALQQADVIFLMGARFNWIFHFGLPPRYAKDVKIVQLDIAPEEIGHNKATEVALVGDGKAIVSQLNKALDKRQWFHAKDSPWRQAIAKKTADNAAQIRPQIDDDAAPAGYYRALRDVAAWMPRNAILSAEGAGTMDIGLTQLPSFNARSCLNAGTYGTMGVRRLCGPSRPAGHPPLGRLGDRLLRHGDGDAGPLQPPGQDRRPEQWRHWRRHAGDPGKPDVQSQAQRADLWRALRPGDGGFRRQGIAGRGPERPARCSRQGNELRRSCAGQCRDLPGIGPQGAGVHLA
jgi:2-hydroxyacyl-CoA lyase 1